MPRRPRFIVPGIAHHITQRGNNRQQVFRTDEDRCLYLDLLVRHAGRNGITILAYCLMTNHVHMVAVPERADSLAHALGWTHSEYAQEWNRAEARTGHLWQGRFYSCPLDRTHLENVIRYVELNPVRAGLVELPWEWRWSSARAHVMERARDPVLTADLVGDGGPWDRRRWKEALLARVSEDDCEAVRRAVRTGEPLGSKEFVAGLEQQAGRRLCVLPRGRPKKVVVTSEDRRRQQDLFVAGGL